MLTPAWNPLRYHNKQAALWREKKSFVAVCAGRGSGKTEIAKRRIVRYLPVKKDWPNPMYFYSLPTYDQARRVAWDSLISLIPSNWLKRTPNKSAMELETVFGSRLFLVGMDKPQRVEGNQYDGCVLDESSDQRPGAFNVSVLPALTHKNGWCWRIGVPKRFGVGAAEYKEFFDLGLSGTDPDTTSYHWTSETVLRPDQIRAAKRVLDERDYNEQFLASWEKAAGRIFYAFDDKLHLTDRVYNSDLPLVIGSDFNVDPMCWVICQVVDNVLYVIDELEIRNTNTEESLTALYEKYRNNMPPKWLFIGDATGRARKSAASATDYLHIVNDTRFENKTVAYLKKNPPLTDRFAACNAVFKNAEGVNRCRVHPKCKRLLSDLEKRTYKPGSREPQDSGDVGHMSDAFGYVVYRLYPPRVKANESKRNILLQVNA